MLRIEQSLAKRLPWLAQYPRIHRPMAGMLGRLADIEGFDFVERVLDVLGTSYRIDPREREIIPSACKTHWPCCS